MFNVTIYTHTNRLVDQFTATFTIYNNANRLVDQFTAYLTLNDTESTYNTLLAFVPLAPFIQ